MLSSYAILLDAILSMLSSSMLFSPMLSFYVILLDAILLDAILLCYPTQYLAISAIQNLTIYDTQSETQMIVFLV